MIKWLVHVWNSLLLLLLLSRFSRVRLCATPYTAAQQAPPSLGFSRQEHWSGLPFPSPMHESEKWKWSHSVVSDSKRLHGLQPTRLFHPWDFPGKSTGVGCHCLLRWNSLIPPKATVSYNRKRTGIDWLGFKNPGFPGGASGKEPVRQCRRHKRCEFSPRVGKIPCRRAWQPTPVFLPGESHRQRSLAGYSP